jgi:hypothetical protein
MRRTVPDDDVEQRQEQNVSGDNERESLQIHAPVGIVPLRQKQTQRDDPVQIDEHHRQDEDELLDRS